MNPKDQIKENLSITDVVSTYIRLEKSGAQFRARCPFHNEKTPSFYVSPERKSFHCFGCQASGDIFSFVEKIENIPFFEALKILADRAGISLQDSQKNKEESRLISLLKEATGHFEENLKRSSEGREYLFSRGLTEETIKTFHIGFAKNEWRDLFIFLASKGYSPEEMEETGLMIKTEKGYYDRFRGRIMFPIRNVSGATVGYSGRILPSLVDPSIAQGKYVNSPETSLYHKSKILFGYDTAKKVMNETKEVIVVEGQMDLCMSYQSGIENTIAVSGTAFTDDHINLIKRFCDRVILSFDADSAGQNALKKSAMLCLLAGLDVYVVGDLGTKDPADLIMQDKELWYTAIKNKSHIIEFLTRKAINEEKDERLLGKKIVNDVLPFLRAIQSPIDRNHFLKFISQKIKISEQTLQEELLRINTAINERKEEIITKLQIPKKEMLVREIIALIRLKDLKDSDHIKDLEIDINLFPDQIIEEEIFKIEEKLTSGNSETYFKDLIKSYKKELFNDKIEVLQKKLRDGTENEEEIMKELSTLKNIYKQV